MTLALRARIFIALLSLGSLASLGYAASIVQRTSVNELVLFSLLIVLAILAEIYATWIPAYRMEMSSSIAVHLAALFILGPALGTFLVFTSTFLSELFLRADESKKGWNTLLIPIFFNVSQFTVAIGLAGLVITLTGHQKLLLLADPDYVLAVISSSAYLFLNLVFVMGIIALTEKKNFTFLLVRRIREFFIQIMALVVLAILITVLYSISFWHVFLILIPLVLVHVSFRSHMRLQTETRKTFERISRILDERDHYTAVHSSDVAELAVSIGQEMGLPQGVIEKIDIAARVHDIGKIAIPDSILLKPGPLDEEEWKVMKKHPEISAELIEGLEIYRPVANAVRHEHEHWDGSGYPDGLKGEEIPFIARIITAADVYNALTTRRPYRDALSAEEASTKLREMKGSTLDPIIADALLRVIASGQQA